MSGAFALYPLSPPHLLPAGAVVGNPIDPFESILSGILPCTIPLFIFPFHLTTVYALNILVPAAHRHALTENVQSSLDNGGQPGA